MLRWRSPAEWPEERQCTTTSSAEHRALWCTATIAGDRRIIGLDAGVDTACPTSVTALRLLAILAGALVLQLALAGAIALWRMRTHRVTPPLPEETRTEVATGNWAGWRAFRVFRRAFEDAAFSQCSFYLQPVDGVPLQAFRPGQYLTFALQVEEEPRTARSGGARTLTRCYSLSDRPDAAFMRITVKRALAPLERPDLPAGVVSGHLLDRVREGDVLEVKAPAGRFVIDDDASVPAVFIAGGVGITPMISMLRWCVETQPLRPLHLFYGVRCGADHAFKQMLESLARNHPALRVSTSYSAPAPHDVPGQDYQHAGRIDLAWIHASVPAGRHQYYVCGPPAMMVGVVAALRASGVDDAAIHLEAFGPASAPAARSASEAARAVLPALDIRCSRSGRTLVWRGEDANLLDFAERHGLVVDSGCRTGSCGSCETALVSGEVAYARTPDYAVAAGRCLLCVATPRSALEIDA